MKPPRPADVRDPEAIVKAVYEVLSGPASQPRDWDRMRPLYAPGARLMPCRTESNGAPVMEILSVEEYIVSRTPLLASADFWEVEVARRESRWGRLAHVMSVYESRRTAEGAAFARGINSIELYFDEARWWMTAVTWDSQHAARALPVEVLAKV
jgi:hypothetical protein